MTLVSVYQELNMLIKNSNDPVFINTSTYVKEMTEKAQAAQISTSELVEVLQDLQRELALATSLNQQKQNENLLKVIQVIIELTGV